MLANFPAMPYIDWTPWSKDPLGLPIVRPQHVGWDGTQCDPKALARLADAVQARPDSMWAAFNQPEEGAQDAITPSDGVTLWNIIYGLIKGIDPTAKVGGFGTGSRDWPGLAWVNEFVRVGGLSTYKPDFWHYHVYPLWQYRWNVNVYRYLALRAHHYLARVVDVETLITEIGFLSTLQLEKQLGLCSTDQGCYQRIRQLVMGPFLNWWLRGTYGGKKISDLIPTMLWFSACYLTYNASDCIYDQPGYPLTELGQELARNAELAN